MCEKFCFGPRSFDSAGEEVPAGMWFIPKTSIARMPTLSFTGCVTVGSSLSVLDRRPKEFAANA